MSTHKVLILGLRMAVAYAGLTTAAMYLVDQYARAVAPLYTWELRWIARRYTIEELVVDQVGGQTRFQVTAHENDFILKEGHLYPPGSYKYQYSILAGYGLQHVVLALILPFAWPELRWRHRVLGLTVVLAGLAVLECIDVPLSILGGLDAAGEGVNDGAVSWAALWREILSTGGRHVLALIAGLLACAIASASQKSAVAPVSR